MEHEPHIQHTVLIVDDEALIRWSLRQKLDAAGFEVLESETGQQALRTITSRSVCAVLLDLHLPDISGLQVLKELRQSGIDCCVWVMTAYSTPNAEIEANKHQVEGFLKKPFDFDLLLTEMQSRITN